METGKLAALMNHQFQIMEFPVSDAMEGGLVIKVEAASICGSDAHVIKFDLPQPGCEGHEFTGRIIKMDSKANDMIHSVNGNLEIGDRIAVYPHITCGKCKVCLSQGIGCSACENGFIYGGPHQLGEGVLNCDPDIFPHFKGGFGEYVHIFPGTFVWKVPDDMPPTIATLLDPLAVGMRAVEMALQNSNGRISTSMKALVIGAGAIGILTAMILKHLGIEQLIISDLNQSKLELAQSISGADYLLNVSNLNTNNRIEAIRDLTDGGADIVINCASHPASQVEGLQMVKLFGTFIEVGNPKTFSNNPYEVTINLPTVLFSRNVKVIGLAANYSTTFDHAFTLLQKHRELPFHRIITHPFNRLTDLNQVFAEIGNASYLKGAFIPN